MCNFLTVDFDFDRFFTKKGMESVLVFVLKPLANVGDARYPTAPWKFTPPLPHDKTFFWRLPRLRRANIWCDFPLHFPFEQLSPYNNQSFWRLLYSVDCSIWLFQIWSRCDGSGSSTSFISSSTQGWSSHSPSLPTTDSTMTGQLLGDSSPSWHTTGSTVTG